MRHKNKKYTTVDIVGFLDTAEDGSLFLHIDNEADVASEIDVVSLLTELCGSEISIKSIKED